MRKLLMTCFLVCMVASTGFAQKSRDPGRQGPQVQKPSVDLINLHGDRRNHEFSLYLRNGVLCYGAVNPGSPEAQWSLQKIGDRDFVLQSQATRQYLQVVNNQLTMGPIQADPRTGSGPHLWRYGTPSKEGETITGWVIENVQSQTALSLGRDARGKFSVLYLESGARTFYWDVAAAPGHNSNPSQHVTYQWLRNDLSKSFVDADEAGLAAVQSGRSKGSDHWERVEMSQGSFALKNRRTNKYLVVQNGKLAMGEAVSDPRGGPTDFQWQLVPSRSNGMLLRHVKSGMHLVLAPGAAAPTLEQEESKGCTWKFDPVSDDHR